MIENVMQNNGLTIAFSGILVVFTGLVLIAIVIHLFNRLFLRSQEGALPPEIVHPGQRTRKSIGKSISPEHLAAITAALEIYRKLYYNDLESRITFTTGEQQSGWKTGVRYGQRLVRGSS